MTNKDTAFLFMPYQTKRVKIYFILATDILFPIIEMILTNQNINMKIISEYKIFIICKIKTQKQFS